MKRVRNTDRKQRIRYALDAGTPVALEELRWRVMRLELVEENRDELTQSDQKSFNRSLRTFLQELAPELSIQRVSRDQGWTAGLLARVAVYRLDRITLLDQFLGLSEPSFHFWSNSRTTDVWEEIVDGEIDVHRPELLPPNAPKRLPSLYPGGSFWPRGGTERRRGLERLGPKYIKRPLVCVKLCCKKTATPVKDDELVICRIPANMALTVIAAGKIDTSQFKPPKGAMFRRWKGVTQEIREDQWVA